jgi:LuxR family transcriptional regulator, maltose regulon positive regulatory protein
MAQHPIATGGKPQPDQRPVSFTPAEERVLPLLATYLTLGRIADRLGVRRSTVKTHVMSIYKKLGTSNRTQAVEQAEAAGFLHDVPLARELH